MYAFAWLHFTFRHGIGWPSSFNSRQAEQIQTIQGWKVDNILIAAYIHNVCIKNYIEPLAGIFIICKYF